MSRSPHAQLLDVPGGAIYFERRGAGPLLLLIPGGPQDAGVFAEIAPHLAKHYTVVAFDPRCNSRSTCSGMAEELLVDVHANDAAALIEAVEGKSAYVFGTSGGAQVGLDLAARYPKLVDVLVAHEPPTAMLLEDPAETLAAEREIYETFCRDGVDAAMARFFAKNALDDSAEAAHAMPPDAAQTFSRVRGNFAYWLAHGMRPLSLYHPDLHALRSRSAHIAVAIGKESAGLPICLMGRALAKKLDIEPSIFPGDHVGFLGPNAGAFAAALHEVIKAHSA